MHSQDICKVEANAKGLGKTTEEENKSGTEKKQICKIDVASTSWQTHASTSRFHPGYTPDQG